MEWWEATSRLDDRLRVIEKALGIRVTLATPSEIGRQVAAADLEHQQAPLTQAQQQQRSLALQMQQQGMSATTPVGARSLH